MEMLVTLIFPALMIAAALHDLTSFKIPNSLTLAMAATWPLAALALGTAPMTMLASVILAAAVLFAGMLLFARGLLGGGDVKLLAAATLWVGPGALGSFFLLTALSGAALAVVLITFRKIPLPARFAAQGWLLDLHTRERAMPYGIAIAIGGISVWASAMASAFS